MKRVERRRWGRETVLENNMVGEVRDIWLPSANDLAKWVSGEL